MFSGILRKDRVWWKQVMVGCMWIDLGCQGDDWDHTLDWWPPLTTHRWSCQWWGVIIMIVTVKIDLLAEWPISDLFLTGLVLLSVCTKLLFQVDLSSHNYTNMETALETILLWISQSATWLQPHVSSLQNSRTEEKLITVTMTQLFVNWCGDMALSSTFYEPRKLEISQTEHLHVIVVCFLWSWNIGFAMSTLKALLFCDHKLCFPWAERE